MDSFNLSCWSEEWYGEVLHLANAHELTQLADDVALKGCSLVTQELGQCSEDQDIALPQKFSKNFCCLTRSHICHNMSHEVVTKDQNTPLCVRVWSSCIVISMPVKSTWSSSKGEVNKNSLLREPSLKHPCVEYTFHSYWSPSTSASPCQTTKTSPATGTAFTTGPDAPHP